MYKILQNKRYVMYKNIVEKGKKNFHSLLNRWR